MIVAWRPVVGKRRVIAGDGFSQRPTHPFQKTIRRPPV